MQDASFNIEAWLFRKVAEGFRRTINRAILIGDGIGKPMGLLNPSSGILICETAPSTPPGQFSWQDLVMLNEASTPRVIKAPPLQQLKRRGARLVVVAAP